MSNRTRRKFQRLSVERLEDRAVPATFGVPWADPSRLTLSFAPDGTSVAGQPSALFKTLDAQQPTAVWQQEILQAFQTWAVQANINIGVVTDGGQPFGAPGPTQHDSQFGDIRVGERRQWRSTPLLDLGAQRPHAREHLGRRRFDQLQ